MSAIFYHDKVQEKLARETKIEYEKSVNKKTATQILPAERFYDAEDYHQKYLLRQHPWLLTKMDVDPAELVSSHVCARVNGYVGGYGDVKMFEIEAPKLNLTADEIAYIIKAARGRGSGTCGI